MITKQELYDKMEDIIDEVWSEGHTSGEFDAAETIERAESDAYDKGYVEGYDDGYDDGLDEGYNRGYRVAASDGYDNGYNDGLGEGYNRGYRVAAYEDGLEAGRSEEREPMIDESRD